MRTLPRACCFPGEEDFGMAPLEVNAAGRPVIAYRGGGAVETVVEGVTGVFFENATSHSLAEAIEKFEGLRWNQYTLRSHAEKFDRTSFRVSGFAIPRLGGAGILRRRVADRGASALRKYFAPRMAATCAGRITPMLPVLHLEISKLPSGAAGSPRLRRVSSEHPSMRCDPIPHCHSWLKLLQTRLTWLNGRHGIEMN